MSGRKGAESFVYLLAIALALLVIVGIAANLGPVVPSGQERVVAELPGGFAGFSNRASRSIDLGSFSVGETQKESLLSFPQLELSANVLGSDGRRYVVNVPEWFESTKRGVRLKFYVQDTNKYGRLVVKWNGKVFFSDFADRGNYNIFINSSYVKSSNTLEMYAEGPGALFWASTVYILKSVELNLEYGPERIIAFQMVPDEISAFDRASLSFWADGEGTLEIKVNGVTAYRGSPKGASEVEFSYLDVPLNSGNNILTFIDREGVYSIQGAALRIFLLDNRSVILRRFNLTEEEFGLLEKGWMKGEVEYNVESVERKGQVTVKLNGNVLGSLSPETGWNSAGFGAEQAQMGENDIEITSTGGYSIPEIKVTLSS